MQLCALEKSKLLLMTDIHTAYEYSAPHKAKNENYLYFLCPRKHLFDSVPSAIINNLTILWFFFYPFFIKHT